MINIETLLNTMATLRDKEKGCTWSIIQTWDSLVQHTLEEAYEVAEAAETKNCEALKEELADLLNQVVFYAQIAKESNLFDFQDVVNALNDKLIRRHPNVFAKGQITDISKLETQWEEIKKSERAKKQQHSILDNIPKTFPALTRAQKIQKRAATVGFDWQTVEEVVPILKSEVQEVETELKSKNTEAAIAELGDVIFSCVNMIRHLKGDAEQAVRKTTRKFESRFYYIEKKLQENHQSIEETSQDTLEKLWQEAKKSQ